MKSLYLATQNVHKVEELSALLGSHFRIHSISELPISEEIPETGLTLAENSMQKARYVAERFGVNPSRISQLHREAIGAMKEFIQ